MRDMAEQQRQTRQLVSVVGASALVYPMLVCAVRLAFLQLVDPHAGAIIGWGLAGLACSVGAVAVIRWGAQLRVASPWLVTALLPAGLFEVWVYWPT